MVCSGLVTAAKPLDYVPADTPYLLANEQRPSAQQSAVMDLMVSGMSLDSVRMNLRSLRVEMNAFADPESLDEEDPDAAADVAEHEAIDGGAIVDLLIAEFDAMQGWSDLSRLGLDARGLFAAYGLGLVPVLRMELSDVEKFRAFVARLETSGGLQFAQWGGRKQPMWALPMDGVALVIAIADGHAVFSVLPADSSAEERALLLAKPARALGHAGLKRFNRENGVLALVSGYLDFARIVHRMTAVPSALEQRLVSSLGGEWPDAGEACGSEMRALAAIAPRITAGYTRFDARAIDMRVVWELREDLAAQLTELKSAAPALDHRSLITLALAVEPVKAIEFAQRQVAAVAEQPFTCEDLLPLNDSIARLGRDLNAVPLGLLLGLQGLAYSVDEFQASEDGIPERIEFSAAVQTSQPDMLLGWLLMSTPQIAEAGLLPDGRPVTVENLQVPMVGKLSLVQSDNLLAGATGPQAPQRLADLAKARPVQPAPLIGARVSGEFYSTLGGFLQLTLQGGQGDQDMQDLQLMMQRIGAEVDLIDMRLSLTRRGLEIYQASRLQSQ